LHFCCSHWRVPHTVIRSDKVGVGPGLEDKMPTTKSSGAVSLVMGLSLIFALVAVPFALVESASSSTAASATPGTLASVQHHPVSHPDASAPDGLFPFTTETGKVYMSITGIGTNTPAGGPVYVQKDTAHSTVQAAYLLAAAVPDYTIGNGTITLDGTSLSFAPTHSVVGNFGVNSVWTNVTTIVAPVVNGASPGLVKFTAAEPAESTEITGEILAVVMNNPTLTTDNTVSFLFGALNTTGTSFSIGLANPLDLTTPTLSLNMSIGDSFGYQGPPGTGQYSTITVNTTLMTSSAGGNDDSTCKYKTPHTWASCSNGTLLTVGGIGDSTADPAHPTETTANCTTPPGPPRCTDELYTLLPFVKTGQTSIQVKTTNPSNNDNIFFSGFELNSAPAVVGEGVVLTPVTGTSPVGTPYTFTAKVQNTTGKPIVTKTVTFTVLSGPNVGKKSTSKTNTSGEATFVDTSSVTGTDAVQASFVTTSSTTVTSNTATVTWTSSTVPAEPTSISTTLSGGSASGTHITVPSGTAVKDSSKVSGTNAATATGTVTYTVYSDSACTKAVSTGTPLKITTPGTLPKSAAVTLHTAGTYYWKASYSGDKANQPSTSMCGPTGEVVTVTSVTTTPTPTKIKTHLHGFGHFHGGPCWWFGDGITVFTGTTVTDSATLYGSNVATAGGTVTYTVYQVHYMGKHHTPTWMEVATAGTFPVTDGSVPNSNPVQLPPGTYEWQASYTGDSHNAPSMSWLGSETETVVPVPHCEHGWRWGPDGGCKMPPRGKYH
jgi:hypothetical protein